MPEFELTPASVRLISTAAQRLLQPLGRPAVKEDVFETIRALGALQIDTIHIVARSPYLALFSRLGAYPLAWLDELLVEGRIFEFWAHAACFLPAEDYPIHRRVMLDGRGTWFSEEWREQNAAAVNAVIEHVRANGPTRSVDFERSDGKKGSWWDWKVEKKALEYWFGKGELMVARRVNFQRVYDLRGRIRPDWDDSRALSTDQAGREMVLKTAYALGAARLGWIADYYRLARQDVRRWVGELSAEGRLMTAAVAGWDDPVYIHPARRGLLEDAAEGRLRAERTTLLSPFDSLIWHRQRMNELFGFEFTIECYLPAAKRKYGYFLLPILRRGELIGRLDAKAHRKERIFEVIALYLEPNVRVDEQLAADLAAALRECAEWHGTPEVLLRRCEPQSLLTLLNTAGRD
jgi:uncharacterized protein YcaQ